MNTNLTEQAVAEFKRWLAEKPEIRSRYNADQVFLVAYSMGFANGMAHALKKDLP